MKLETSDQLRDLVGNNIEIISVGGIENVARGFDEDFDDSAFQKILDAADAIEVTLYVGGVEWDLRQSVSIIVGGGAAKLYSYESVILPLDLTPAGRGKKARQATEDAAWAEWFSQRQIVRAVVEALYVAFKKTGWSHSIEEKAGA